MVHLALDFEPAATVADLHHDVEAAFTRREWIVIRLARSERGCAARPSSRLNRLISTLLGLHSTNPLADPKLEALREAAAQLWHGNHRCGGIPVNVLRDHGYSFGQITLLSSWIADQSNWKPAATNDPAIT